MDRKQLADFLRSRRQSLRPQDVGLAPGPRRRTPGLRREEVATLSEMSTDYYARLEQSRGPAPSAAVLSSISRALRLSPRERDHLYLLAGRQAPRRPLPDVLSPGLVRLLDLLHASVAQIVSPGGETLGQTPLSQALFGDDTVFEGLERSLMYRWFTRTETRRVYAESDHARHSKAFTAQLRAASTRQGPGSFPRRIVEALLANSEEFATLWERHEIEVHHESYRKRVLHPGLGAIDLDSQLLFSDGQTHGLLVFTTLPGTRGAQQLRELSNAILT
ncbi:MULTISPECIES: helix-turn-helix domain-containing protein [unclassified Streptomyces]|uniref:helix-turn-helix transcriptional regulator n=1 Tax=unclassified Streptomyces TaxID=2593676 RepID=UPI001438DED1|nr:helix-turn-helix domain-containing protein [Streptomyces sp. NEAU-H3]NJA58556.1 helix-turn-helix domain-containing protein [Streptomyces sp. NEAU-H3]